MNALANSQMNELEKFIDQADLPEALRPTFARYTGQEDQDERDLIRHRRPDILLTNFMMLELLMTRQSERDRQVIANADGLDCIVLDELHTYRVAKELTLRCWFAGCETVYAGARIQSASGRLRRWRARVVGCQCCGCCWCCIPAFRNIDPGRSSY